MKALITSTVLTLLFASFTFSQDRNHTERLTEKKILEKQLENNLNGLNDFDTEDTRAITKKTKLDNGFLLIETISQNWVAILADWKNSINLSYTYDGNNNLSEEIWQNWNNSMWENFEKYSYSYDGNNNLTGKLYQNWNGSDWVNFWKNSYTYDGNNNRTEELSQNWTGSEWKNFTKTSYTYDLNHNQTEAHYQYWDNSTWINDYKYSYTYNANNYLTIKLLQTWYQNITWANSEKITNTYDISDNLIETKNQTWGDVGGIYNWITISRYFNTYNSNNYITKHLYQTLNGLIYVNNNQWLYTYDENNNMIESLYQDFNNTYLNEKWTYTYDGNNNLIESVYQDWSWNSSEKWTYTYDGNNNQIEKRHRNWNGSAWVNLDRLLFSFVPVTAIEENSCFINSYYLSNNYPNPFNPSTKLTYSIPEKTNVNLKVFDLLGSEVVELVNGEIEKGSYDISFNASNLPSGVYFYRLQAGDFVQTRKMILLK